MTVVEEATTTYEKLSEEECEALLSEGTVGRLAVVVDGQPLVFPVNYRFSDGVVVFRSNDGTKRGGADFNRVAFEVDALDGDGDGGWSILVQGTGYDITTALDHRAERLRRLAIEPAVRPGRTRWVEIVPDTITGRRVGAPAGPASAHR